MAENYDGASTSAELISTLQAVGAFPLTAGSKVAVLLIEISSGAYTVQLRSADDEQGRGLPEIYEIR